MRRILGVLLCGCILTTITGCGLVDTMGEELEKEMDDVGEYINEAVKEDKDFLEDIFIGDKETSETSETEEIEAE